MFKNVFLAAAATLILAAVTIPVGSTMKERKAFRKECRAHHKAAKKAA